MLAFLGSAWLWLLRNPFISSTIALGILLGIQTWRLHETASRAAVDIAEARQHEAEAKQLSDQINALYARNDAKNERARAENERKNAEELAGLQSHANTLQATLNQKQRDFNKAASTLKGIIANAKPEDKAPLGAVMRAYFDCLRKQQASGNGAVDCSTPAGGND